MKVCTCINCETSYYDPNPGKDSIEYPDTPVYEELVEFADDGGIYWGCPKCETDSYLVDNVPYIKNL